MKRQFVCLKCRHRFTPVNEFDPSCPSTDKEGKICESRDVEAIIDTSASRINPGSAQSAEEESKSTVIVTVTSRGEGQRKRVAEEIASMFTMSGRRVKHFRMGKPPSLPKDVDVAIVEEKTSG